MRKKKKEMIDTRILPSPPPPKDALRLSRRAIGMHVCAHFSEQCISPLLLIALLTSEPLFTDTLDAIKFMCKDL